MHTTYLRGVIAHRQGDAAAGDRLIAEANQRSDKLRNFMYFAKSPPVVTPAARIQFLEDRFASFLRFEKTENCVVSFPKCGNTWVTAVLGKYALGDGPGDPLDLFQVTEDNPATPTTNSAHDGFRGRQPLQPHTGDKSIYAGKRVAFLVRDPRDVIVSFYYHHTLRAPLWGRARPNFSGSLSEFIRHHEGRIENVIEFYNIWARHRRDPEEFWVLRYEDLRQSEESNFRKLMAHFRWRGIDDDRFDAAVRYGSFENMKAMEADNTSANPRLARAAGNDHDAYKVRRGTIGGYADELGDGDIQFLDRIIDAQLDPLFSGYHSENSNR